MNETHTNYQAARAVETSEVSPERVVSHRRLRGPKIERDHPVPSLVEVNE